MADKFIKPHCRVLSANISEIVVQAEELRTSWIGWKGNINDAKPHLSKMEENFNALPEEISNRLAPYMDNLRTLLTLEHFWEYKNVTENIRELQKIALSEGLVQIAACIVEE